MRMNQETEFFFIKHFIKNDSQERLMLLLSGKRRRKGLSLLESTKCFIPNVIHRIDDAEQTNACIASEILKRVKNREAYVISGGEFDQERCDFKDVLDKMFGLCIQYVLYFEEESFCYFESEEVKERFFIYL